MSEEKNEDFEIPPIVQHTDELTAATLRRAHALHLNKETRIRLWFISYDDPYFAKRFSECEDDEVEYLLSALDFDVKTYSGPEYTRSRAAKKYCPPYEDRFIGVVSHYERYTPEEREKAIKDREGFKFLAELSMGEWYEDEPSDADNPDAGPDKAND